MIVGTAGHIDHGKTTLVKALTGVDTDRLPEEKQRGISIELGYAFLDVPPESPPVDADEAQPPWGADANGGRGLQSLRLGFIDVPGHERLVHTMLAGATGIDLALLLVAADDGPMPQTLEHLAVLSLLGLRRGAVVITKADRADAARLAEVQAQAQAQLAGSSLEGAPLFTVAATAGEGVAELRAWLLGEARRIAAEQSQAASRQGQAFRLAIDRAFSLSGVGTVVTGTVHAGRVQVGDELLLLPGSRRLRVRSLRAQDREVAEAQAGERCALGLAGIAKDEITRGQWLAGPQAASVSDRIDVQLLLWQGEAKALRSGMPVHVHLGSAAVMGTVALLDEGVEALAPGQAARVQLVLREPVGAWWGDRVVLRDASASRTLAGGRVLDPLAPARYRRTPQRLAELDALGLAHPAERLARLIGVAPQGLDLDRFAAAQGGALPALPEGALRSQAPAGAGNTAVGNVAAGCAGAAGNGPATGSGHEPAGGLGWALGPTQTEAARVAVQVALAAHHERAPMELGPDAARLRRLALPRLPEPLWQALLTQLLTSGQVLQRGAFVHLPEHGVRLSASEERIAQKVAPQLDAAGFEGAWVRDLARDSGESEPLMRVTLARLAQRGEIHQVVKDLYYPQAAMARLAALARAVAAGAGSEVTAAQFRDATQLGRKRAIQILEYLDRIGLLRRVGDTHKLRSDSSLFMADESDHEKRTGASARPQAGAG